MSVAIAAASSAVTVAGSIVRTIFDLNKEGVPIDPLHSFVNRVL